MSTWLNLRIPRYLVKYYFWVCLWGCFQNRLAIESMDWVKQMVFPKLGGWSSFHPLRMNSIHLNRKRLEEERILPFSLSACVVEMGQWSYLAFGTRDSQGFRLGLESTPLTIQLLGVQTASPTFLSLKPEDDRALDFSTSKVTWTNSSW